MTTKLRESARGQSPEPDALISSEPVHYSESISASAAKPNWFSRLPIRQKPLLTLLASEALSILALTGASSLLLLWGGKLLLDQQARTEVAVMQTLAEAGFDQSQTSIRGLINQSALLDAAKEYGADRPLPSDAIRSLRQLLRNEAKARNLEYLTLVGSDGRIIASANADRSGKSFDPQGLVQAVLANPRELQSLEQVSSSELEQEQPPLPSSVKDSIQDNALIHYSLVPVQDPDSLSVMGVLVGGQILNQDRSLVNQTLSAYGNGYSGIYLHQPNNRFSLVTSLNWGNAADLSQATPQVPLPDTQLLQAATAALPDSTSLGEIRTAAVSVAGQTYKTAAVALPDSQGRPVAVLVRGTSQTALLQLLKMILGLQLGLGAILLLIDLLLATLLGRSLVNPIQKLRRVTNQFAQGERWVRAEPSAPDEVGELALAFNSLADSITQSESLLQDQNRSQIQATERAKLLTQVSLQIRQLLDIEAILQTAVEGVRTLLQADRVVIYRFNDDFTGGEIAAESVGAGWIKAFGRTILDPLNPASLERYRTGRISKLENLAEANLSRCHCEILERLEVQANLVAPILVGDRLLGLLCAHQCASPRLWLDSDIELMQQISTQVGYGIWQVILIQQQQALAERERQLNATVLKMRESLEPDQIFNRVLQECRAVLAADRTVVYLFNEQWVGTIVAESVADDYPMALGAQIADPCFADSYVEKYRQGRVQATANIRQAGLTDCHIRQLEAFQIKANLVAPILVKGNLLGLLIAHQCSGPRQWQEIDIGYMRQLAVQFGFALEQANLFQQKEQARLEAEALSEERQQQKEQLQHQLLNLLAHVEGAAQGNLTVRAEVTPGEIGTVADFFNAIIESLRRIVTQVKRSAVQVNLALGQNEDAIHRLTEDAVQQAEETTRTLDSVEQMTRSIQAVADNARQAAQVARTAFITAETGGMAMEMTVHNILSLRETIGDTAKKVKRLGESSQQISRVVSLINQIALQTNLLAINAGIEAARAGEQGQGFAIVAEEVGELAVRSAEATQEIEKVVATIQRETSQVVEAMEQSTVQVVEGTHLVEEVKHSLQQILEVSRQIDGLVQLISEATVTQAATSEAVSHLMQQVTQVSEQTAQSSQQVAVAIQQTVAVAQGLRDSVETFNVGELPSQ
jgi:twitching motility protein PilJ